MINFKTAVGLTFTESLVIEFGGKNYIVIFTGYIIHALYLVSSVFHLI